MASIKSLYYKKIAQDILDDKNNDYKWLNVKLKKHFRIDSLDKINNFLLNQMIVDGGLVIQKK